MNYRAAKVKAHKEKCRRGGISSGKARRAKMLLVEATPRLRDAGDFIGTMELRLDNDVVRRWVLRQGPRANNITISIGGAKKHCGWDTLMSGLRKHLAPITRQST